MSDSGRIELSDFLQNKWFCQAMAVMSQAEANLSEYDRGLFQDLRGAYQLSGRDLTITLKQMNHIRLVASEIKTGKYR